MSFGSAVGSFGQSFAPSAMQAYAFFDQIARQKMEREAARAYGAGLGSMGAPQIPGGQAMPSFGAMQPYPQAPSPGTPPQSYPQQQPSPPGSPVQQGVQQPFPRPKPDMGQPMPQGAPMPQQGPLQGMPDAAPRSMSAPGNMGQPGQGGGPFQNLTLQQVVAGIRQHAPGISDEALGMAVDRFMPMLNAQAQFQWRQMTDARDRQKMDDMNAWRDRQGDRYDRQGDQRDRSLDQRDASQAGIQSRFDARETRLRDRETRAGSAKLSPEQAARQKFFSQRYNQDAHAAREAYDALLRLQSYGGRPEDVAKAQEEYTRANALAWRAQQDYEQFLEEVGGAAAPAASVPATPAKPATAPAKPTAKPAAPPPPPGFTESGGTGGPLLEGERVYASAAPGETAYDSPRSRGVTPDSKMSTPDRNSARPAPAMFAPRSPGDKPTPVPGDFENPVDVAGSMQGDYDAIRLAMAQLKAAHAAHSQTAGQTSAFRREQATNAKRNKAMNKIESDASGSYSFANVERRLKELDALIIRLMRGDDELTRRDGKRQKPREAGDIPMPSSPRNP